jgi:NTE family protein
VRYSGKKIGAYFILTAIVTAVPCALAQSAGAPPNSTAPAEQQPAQLPAASPPSVPGHPTLGLVLEGGGALGLAHVGVLEWLEEHRIPVSYVAGTSMGGLVGGLYATGESAAEVRATVSKIPWDDVLRGQTPFKDLSFRRKEDAHDYPSSIEFGLHHGIQFPGGFNSGQQVTLILDRVALPYSTLPSFNDLPIPFACVATDLVSGEKHVFRSGSLALALRSTMSLPGIFSPVRDGDHLYADGGLLNNIPIEVAKSMGADVIVGIDLKTAGINPDDPMSSFGVLGRAISVMIAANEDVSKAKTGLIVSVPLQKYTALDYDKADEIIKVGYDAAVANADKLLPYAVTEQQWTAYLTERNARRLAPPVPQFVQVIGAGPKAAQAIEKEAQPFVGKPIDSAALDQAMLTLQGMGPYESVSYSIVDKNGQPGLQIDAQPKPYAPPIIRPLILIDGSDYNNVLFSLGARITYLNFGQFRSELRNDVMLGSEYGLMTEYFHPFTPESSWFVAPRVAFASTLYPIYSGSMEIATYRLRQAGGGLDVGYQFGRVAEMRLGYEGGYEKYSQQIGTQTVIPSSISGGTGDVRLQYELDELDDPVIPHSGQYALLYQKYYNANPDAPGAFPLFYGRVEKFIPISKPAAIFATASGGTTFGYNAGIPAFSLGGSLQLVGYSTNSLLTNQYYLGQIGYLRKLMSLPPFLGDSLQLIVLLEAGRTYQLPNGPVPPKWPGDIAAGFIVNTIFGPIEVAGAAANYDRQRFFFRIGRIF